MHQRAGTGIWRHDMLKNTQKQQHKKVKRNKRNRNLQSSRHNDVEAVNQLFGANKVEIKQKMLEALRLLRQADNALNKFANTSMILPRTCEPQGPLIPRESAKENWKCPVVN